MRSFIHAFPKHAACMHGGDMAVPPWCIGKEVSNRVGVQSEGFRVFWSEASAAVDGHRCSCSEDEC